MAADFTRLVSLGCHDLRTPLATMQGFAKTLVRRGGFDESATRWLGMIDTAGDELVELIELLSLAARIEGGRYDPVLREADSLELAREAVSDATGSGRPVLVDPAAVTRAVSSFARAAARHGATDVAVAVEGERITIAPVAQAVAPIVLGEDPKDLGAAVGARLVRALGGAVEVADERLLITLPAA